ncbi:hypothetical protein OIN60_18125 [Paenibacillus sp. P96]|uniref:VCBS repeat-containing protein n=1 Tax=Paenibacillus zeirhizosphaerae TaxID=2987519 RepID=A0ABT9FVA3_9BACL|nr:hypothetical protein [Paenibacillus sp. P96]MDP4098653.1 hypothetical protein [Paenibacillus sp. P96]
MLTKLRALAFAGVLLATAFLLSGCATGNDSDPVSLMREPLLPDENQKLHGVITSQLAGNQIVSPRDPEDTTSIRVGDLNNDGVQEAVLFYETPEDENVRIHGMLLENQGGTWVKKLTFNGAGLVLESFKLVDVTNDGTIDIVAGFSRGEEDSENNLIVYSYTGGTLETVWQMPYSHFVVDDNKQKPMDLNGDKVTDITIISFLRNEYFTVTTYQYNNGFREIGRLDLESQVSSVYNVVAGQVAENKTGLIIDTMITQSASVSNIIIMKGGQMQRLDLVDHTYRDGIILSEDVDKDGILEFGLLERPAGWEDADPVEVPYFVTFYQWDGERGTIFKLQQYRDTQNLFIVSIPNDLHGKVTIDRNSDRKRYLRFVRIENGEVLAEIKFFSLSQWDEHKGDWEEMVRTSGQVVGIKESGAFKPKIVNMLNTAAEREESSE